MLGRCCCGPPLTAASCSAAQHWSTHSPARPVTSSTASPRTAGVPLRGYGYQRRQHIPTDQRGTRGGTHADAEGASRRLRRTRWEGQSNSSPSSGPPPGHSTWHPVPYLLAPPQPHPRRHLLPKSRLSTTDEPPAQESNQPSNNSYHSHRYARDRAGRKVRASGGDTGLAL